MSATGTSPLATPMPSREFPRETQETPDIKGKFADNFFGEENWPGCVPASFCPPIKIIASDPAAEI
jgi:hypothetical protein